MRKRVVMGLTMDKPMRILLTVMKAPSRYVGVRLVGFLLWIAVEEDRDLDHGTSVLKAFKKRGS